jgi:hypothetical protein
MPTTHHKHGPSSLRYKEICPQWQSQPGTSDAAEEGTAMHHAAETGDMTGLNDEQQAQVKECLEYTKLICELATQTFNELQLDVAGLTFGTADVVAIYPDHGHVIDYKFGRNPVDDADVNLQGWAYALGVFHMFPVERVTVHFLMPRLDAGTKNTFTRDEVPRLRTRIAAVIDRAESPDAPANPEPKACQYCNRKASCPALASKALMIPTGNKWDLPANLDPSAITDPTQMAKILPLVPLIESWASAIKANALEMARNGQQIPGYSLRHRSGKRVIKDVLTAFDVLQTNFGVELHDFLPACSVSIGAVEDAVKAKAEKGGGAKILRELNSRMAEAGLVTTTAEVEYLAKDKN